MKNKNAHKFLIAISALIVFAYISTTANAAKYSDEEKVASLVSYTKNILASENGENNYYISQENIGKIARYLNYHQFSYSNIFNARLQLSTNNLPFSNEVFKLEDARKILRDFLDIRKRMDELEQLHGFRCIFAFGDIMKRSIEKSIFSQSAKYLSSIDAKELLLSDPNQDNRQVIGLCWEKDLFPASLIE